MNSYNLIARRKELLRKLVKYVREGKLEEPIVPVGTDQGYFIPLRGGGFLEHQGDLVGDLKALCDSDLMSFRWEKGNKLYGIRKAGYDAVDAQTSPKITEKAKVQCSFCRRTQDEVNRLIAGPDNSFICDECVELCRDIRSTPIVKDRP